MNKNAQTIKTLLVFLLLSATAAFANDRFGLHYDSPANKKSLVNKTKGKRPTEFGFMQTAFLQGNDPWEAMFTGGIAPERMNHCRLALDLTPSSITTDTLAKQSQSTVEQETNKQEQEHPQQRKQSAGGNRDGSKNNALASEEETNHRKPKAKAKHVDNPDLPNVLIIGDSISMGYTPHVRKQLKGKADVYRIPGNGQNSSYGVQHLEKWLTMQPAKWDVIHFNWGLWDICYRHPDSKVQGHRDKVNGTLTNTPEQNRANMEKIVARLKQTNAKLIWCTTTPVPANEAGRKVGDEVKYNQIAEKIMKANRIQINDLHSHARLKLPAIMAKEGDVHFNRQGYLHLADKVAAEILSALTKQLRLDNNIQ